MSFSRLDGPASAAPIDPAGDTPWRGFVVTAVFALAAPVNYLGNEGVSPLVALGGLLTLPSLLRARRPSPGAALGVGVITALVGWAVVSFAWSPMAAPQLAHLHGYGGLQALIAPKLIFQLLLYGGFLHAALSLSPVWRRRALWVLAISIALTVAVICIEAVEGAQLYQWLSRTFSRPWTPDLAKRNVAHGCYGPTVLFWPAAAVLHRRGLGGLAVVLFLAIPLSCLGLGEDSPMAAFAVSLAAFVVVWRLGRPGVWACLAAAVAYFMLAPLPFATRLATPASLPGDIGKMSWHVRMEIWRFASVQSLRHPLIGWGLDSSRAWPDHIPMHPHDAALQLWLETGVVGAALAALFWAWLFVGVGRITRDDRAMGAISAAAAAAYLLVGAVSFGVWQEWWIALGVLAIAACRMGATERKAQGALWRSAGLIPLGDAELP